MTNFKTAVVRLPFVERHGRLELTYGDKTATRKQGDGGIIDAIDLTLSRLCVPACVSVSVASAHETNSICTKFKRRSHVLQYPKRRRTETFICVSLFISCTSSSFRHKVWYLPHVKQLEE